VSNGSLVEFDDAYNVLEYSQLDGGELAPAADLLGSSTTITDALDTGTVSGAFTVFFDQGSGRPARVLRYLPGDLVFAAAGRRPGLAPNPRNHKGIRDF
jgi:hypothetical protein